MHVIKCVCTLFALLSIILTDVVEISHVAFFYVDHACKHSPLGKECRPTNVFLWPELSQKSAHSHEESKFKVSDKHEVHDGSSKRHIKHTDAVERSNVLVFS